MNTALVTGTIDRTDRVALSLKPAGFAARVWEGPTAGAADAPPTGSVDC